MATDSHLKHLEAPERRLFRDFCASEDFSDVYSQKILLTALEAHQRARKAREIIDQEGMCVTDKWNQRKPHPMLITERDSRSAFLTAMKMLNIDVEKSGPVGRPPGR
jgi:hypothetical protein